MSQAGETFFTSVGCMDGRVQEPIKKFGQQKFGAQHPDTITEAGLVGLLSKDDVSQSLLNSIKQKLLISLEKHASRGIVVHGHQECAGNPVTDEAQKDDIRKSVGKIKDLVNASVPVVGVFVKRANENSWVVEEL